MISALLTQFLDVSLPRALLLKDYVDKGYKLNPMDMAFLEQLFKDAQNMFPLIDRNPEYHEFIARAIHLYQDITHQALKNEQEGQS